MPLGSAEIEQIGTYVRANLAEWMEDIVGPRLLGRAARVEDELTFQRELICTRFEAVDKRFEEMLHRFDTVDKRFEDIHHRFDAVDKRFEDMHRSMETRFQAVDKRFEDLHRSMDKRFEAVDTRFEGMQRNMETRFEGGGQALRGPASQHGQTFRGGGQAVRRHAQAVQRDAMDGGRRGGAARHHDVALPILRLIAYAKPSPDRRASAARIFSSVPRSVQ